MVRIAFCGTPQFAVPQLEALLSDSFFQVVQVVTQPDRPAGRGHKMQACALKQKALEKNLPVISPENINAPEVIQQLRALKLDAIVVVAFGQILKKDFLALCPHKCVNLHGSLLPRWRGAAPIQRSLMEGDTRSGVSLQVVVPKLDAGPVIGERALDLPLAMNALELHNALAVLGAELFTKDFKLFLQGEVTPQVQDESLVTYAHKISKEESQINWNQPAAQIHNHVRGLAMGPYAWTPFKGKAVKIHRTLPKAGRCEPGKVYEVQKDILVLGTGEGLLEIHELQPESKKRLSTKEFLLGTEVQQGEHFGA